MPARRSSERSKSPADSDVADRRTAQPGDGGAGPAADAAQQTRLFEEGVRLFQAEQFLEARDRFRRAAQGPLAEMAHAARQRVRMCELRLSRGPLELKSAEDRYNYAVLLLNQRRWEEAELHLRRAIEEQPAGDHFYYALALCLCWRGDMAGALQCLRRAIELDPNNRIAARNDPDFVPFAAQPPLADLLKPDRGSGG